MVCEKFVSEHIPSGQKETVSGAGKVRQVRHGVVKCDTTCQEKNIDGSLFAKNDLKTSYQISEFSDRKSVKNLLFENRFENLSLNFEAVFG